MTLTASSFERGLAMDPWFDVEINDEDDDHHGELAHIRDSDEYGTILVQFFDGERAWYGPSQLLPYDENARRIIGKAEFSKPA